MRRARGRWWAAARGAGAVMVNAPAGSAKMARTAMSLDFMGVRSFGGV